MSRLKVILSDSLNPYLNLATEEWIFHNLEANTQILFLWRNEETVVIGRNQNPWSECNLGKMKDDGVHLARRTTGGGAVFHDLGNTNFTFLSPKSQYRRENNIEIILGALKSFGIAGYASGRNDLLGDFADGPRKFSGSAYREKKDRAFHHGTLLLNADLTRLGRYLTPNPKKLQAKGKESVRARVSNLNELVPHIQHDQVVEACIASFEKFYSEKADIESLSMLSLQKIPELRQQFENLSSFDWLYGQTLAFNMQMDHYLSLGFFEFQFKVQDALIQDIKIFSDCLYPSLVEDLERRLKFKSFTSLSVKQVMVEIHALYPNIPNELLELEGWLSSQFEI